MNLISDLNNLRYFAHVVGFGGFTAAANELGLQTSLLSRRISQLETELGVRLLHRTTRHISLTETGKVFYAHCLDLLDDAHAAEDAIRQTIATPSGLIRLSCPTGLLQGGVAELLVGYLRLYPDVRLSLEATNRRVDVVSEGFDLAIRVRQPPLEDSDLAMRTLGLSPSILVASPELLLGREEPKDIFQLGEMPTVSMACANDRYNWRLQDASGKLSEFSTKPRLLTDDLMALYAAALAGIGVAQLPQMMVSADLAAKRLVHILPDRSPTPGLVHAVFASRKGMIPAVRSLLDHLSVGFVNA